MAGLGTYNRTSGLTWVCPHLLFADGTVSSPPASLNRGRDLPTVLDLKFYTESSTVNMLNCLDEATRAKVLAELPEELQRRYEHHAASMMQHAARLNYNANSVQRTPSGFVNLSTPETVVGHTMNAFRAPAAGLAHAILNTSATCSSYNIGVESGGAGHNYGTPMAHHMARLPPGSRHIPVNGANGFFGTPQGLMGGSSTQVNGTNSHGFLGPYTQELRSRSFAAKGPGQSTSHSFDPRLGMVHNTTVVTTARQQQLGAASMANMQMGPSTGNPMHLPCTPQRFASLPPGAYPPGLNGHLVRYKPMISTYLDDFKQGFPSKGLSTVSSRWWGSAEPDKTAETEDSSAGGRERDASGLEEDSLPESSGPAGLSITPGNGKEAIQAVKSCRKVTGSRKRAAVSGKRALQLGVAKGYGVQKVGHKEGAILTFVFGDSLPRQWLPALPANG